MSRTFRRLIGATRRDYHSSGRDAVKSRPRRRVPLVGRNIDDALPSELTHIIRQSVGLCKEGNWRPREPGDFEYIRQGHDTSILEYVVTPSRLSETDGPGDEQEPRVAACLTFVDITKRRHAESKVAFGALRPPTGLPNPTTRREIGGVLSRGVENVDAARLFRPVSLQNAMIPRAKLRRQCFIRSPRGCVTRLQVGLFARLIATNSDLETGRVTTMTPHFPRG